MQLYRKIKELMNTSNIPISNLHIVYALIEKQEIFIDEDSADFIKKTLCEHAQQTITKIWPMLPDGDDLAFGNPKARETEGSSVESQIDMGEAEEANIENEATKDEAEAANNDDTKKVQDFEISSVVIEDSNFVYEEEFSLYRIRVEIGVEIGEFSIPVLIFLNAEKNGIYLYLDNFLEGEKEALEEVLEKHGLTFNADDLLKLAELKTNINAKELYNKHINDKYGLLPIL